MEDLGKHIKNFQAFLNTLTGEESWDSYHLQVIEKLLGTIPETSMKSTWEGDEEEPDSLTITITAPRGSSPEYQPAYQLAKATFARFAIDCGSTITGNFEETCNWDDDHTYYKWKIPYMHYGS